MGFRYPIQDSVGRGGRNFHVDVVTVQQMLNEKMPIPMRPLQVNGICDWVMVQAIETYQQRALRMANPTGRLDPGDATHVSLNFRAVLAPSNTVSNAGKKYTTNPNEVGVQTTKPTPRQVVEVLISTWPDLGEQGARTLTAQFLVETGGQYCFNWNLGNVKSATDKPHIYLRAVWECRTKSQADADVKDGKGLARIAAEDEIKKKGWSCADTVVVFSPPHHQCRFRAFSSLQQGAQSWIDHHKTIVQKNPEYLKVLQAGDTAGAAKALNKAGYYTAKEAAYAKAMKDRKMIVDAEMGLVILKVETQGVSGPAMVPDAISGAGLRVR